MGTTSRGVQEKVIRGLAKVGLVWAVFVLGALFMAMSAQGQDSDGGYALASSAVDQTTTSFSVQGAAGPSTAGLALVLTVIAGGLTVLAIGAARAEREPTFRFAEGDAEPEADLGLALGLGIFA